MGSAALCVTSADFCTRCALTAASAVPSLSLCIRAGPGVSTPNQAEGRREDLCHQGEREFAPVLVSVILPPPSLQLVVKRWVPVGAGPSFLPAKGQHGSKMPLEYAVLATAPVT